MVRGKKAQRIPERNKILVMLDVDGHLLPYDVPGEYLRQQGLEKLFKQQIVTYDYLTEKIELAKGKKKARLIRQIQPPPISSLNAMRTAISERKRAGNPITYQELYDFARNLPLSPGVRGFIKWCQGSPYVHKVVLMSSSFQPFVDAIADRLGIPRDDAHGIQLLHRTDREAGAKTPWGVPREFKPKLERHKALSTKRYHWPKRLTFASDDGLTGREWIKYINDGGGIAIAHNPSEHMIEGSPDFAIAGRKFWLYKGLIKMQFQYGANSVRARIQELARRYRLPFYKLLAFSWRPEAFVGLSDFDVRDRLRKKSSSRRQQEERIAKRREFYRKTGRAIAQKLPRSLRTRKRK